MTRNLVTALTLAATVMAGATVAEAGGKHKGRYYGGKHIHGHVWVDHGYRYGYGYRHGPNCRYFLKKAKRTGSHYWFNRYRNCISIYR